MHTRFGPKLQLIYQSHIFSLEIGPWELFFRSDCVGGGRSSPWSVLARKANSGLAESLNRKRLEERGGLWKVDFFFGVKLSFLDVPPDPFFTRQLRLFPLYPF